MKAEKIILPSLTILLLLAIWQVISYLEIYSKHLFPSPIDVGSGFTELAMTSQLWEDIGSSLVRFFIGYGLAVVTAGPLGFIFGWYSRGWTAFEPLVQLLRPISPIAWFPLISLWFGIGNLPAIVIIYIAAFYTILLATISAVRKVDQTYLKVARNFGTNQAGLLIKVVLPAAFPAMMVGLHIAIGSAWVFLVAGEMLGVKSGLGYLIIDSRNMLRTDLVLVAILIIGLLGLLIDRTITKAENSIRKLWGVVQQ
ncbi:MAG: ABC transporter permease [Armatimonadota bacterium]